ncbi:hypothetical protein QJQ45_025478, partial [Haematococcus lacustris]
APCKCSAVPSHTTHSRPTAMYIGQGAHKVCADVTARPVKPGRGLVAGVECLWGKKPVRKPPSNVVAPPRENVGVGDAAKPQFMMPDLQGIVSSFPWPRPQQTSSPDGPVESTTQRQKPRQPADISQFLVAAPVWELKQMRRLCHLTSLTYKMHLVTPRALRRKHALDLVTTSWACEVRTYEPSKTAIEIASEGDGMAMSMSEASALYIPGDPTSPEQPSTPAPSSSSPSLSLYEPAAADGQGSGLPPTTLHPATASADSGRAIPLSLLPADPPSPSGADPTAADASKAGAGIARRWQSTGEMVAALVMEAASAASSVAASATAAATSPLASAASSLYAGLASLPIASALGAGPLSSAPTAAAAVMAAAAKAAAAGVGGAVAALPGTPPSSKGSTASGAGSGGAGSLASTALPAAAAASSLAASLAAAAAGPAAIAAAPGSTSRLAAPVQSTTGSPACPSEWFVCDDPASAVRYFVIQGSDTFDHWKLNLTFDPVIFEDPGLGVKVHRGVYEAAQILYKRFLPMVYEHLDSSPCAKVCFTGHSIGGSLSTLLAFMYIRRGVLPPSSLATIYTYGAPAVFCEFSTPSPSSPATPGPTLPTRPTLPYHPKEVGLATVSTTRQPANSSSSSSSSSSSQGLAGLSPLTLLTVERSSAALDVDDPLTRPLRLRQQQQLLRSPQPLPSLTLTPTTMGVALANTSSSSGPGSSQGAGLVADPVCPCCCGAGEHGGDGAGLLAKLGLHMHSVRNVIMARDIVPRAFACDYSLVADILKGWGAGFKSHGGLLRPGRKHLYSFIGQLDCKAHTLGETWHGNGAWVSMGRSMVMQPDRWHWFAGSDTDHPLLPPGPNLWLISTPQQQQQQQQQGANLYSRLPSPSLTPTGLQQPGVSQGRGWRQAGPGLSSPSRDSFNAPALSPDGSPCLPPNPAPPMEPSWVHGGWAEEEEAGSPPPCPPAAALHPDQQVSKDGNDDNSDDSSCPSSTSATSSARTYQDSNQTGCHSHAISGNSQDSPAPQPSTTDIAAAAQPEPRASRQEASRQVAETQGAADLATSTAAPRSAQEVMWSLMDSPHPLDILADPGAYLERGSISRFHNPDNYTAALGRIIYHQRQVEGKVPSWVLSAYSRGLGLLAAEEAAEAELGQGQGQGRGWAGHGQECSGSGQQDQGQGQAVKVVIAERRQVIKAALRGLVEAAQPDLSPAEVDAFVAEVNKRMTMGSKQCVLAAVLCLSVLLQSFLGQPTRGFPAAGPAPGPPPPPDPAYPPYAHPRLATRTSPRSAAPAQLPPSVPLNILDPKTPAQAPPPLAPAQAPPPLAPAQAPPPPNPAQDPPPPPAQNPPPPPAQAPPPPPPAQAQPLPAAPGPAPPPQAPPGGRWLDWDTNGCLNLQHIGESMQRPLELCQWDDLEALPPVGKEYQQGYKLINDRLPKVRQRLHRAAEYRRGIDGRARNNA